VEDLPGESDVSIVVDQTSPTTELSTSGPKYESETGEVFVSSQTGFELSADDTNPVNPSIETSGVSGINYHYYSEVYDSEQQIYEEPFSLEGEGGEYTVEYASVDVAGNTEPQNLQTFYLDSTSPVSSDDSDGEWHNEDVTVAISSDDGEGSGVRKIVYEKVMNGEEQEEQEVFADQVKVNFEDEGVHDLSYYAIDNVENVEEENRAAPIKIDKTPPASEIKLLDGGAYYNDSTWPGIFGEALDSNQLIETSGVKHVEVRIDQSDVEGEWAEADGTNDWSFDFEPEDGSYTIYLRATDLAGNQEHTFQVSFIYDSTTPTTSFHLSGVQGLSDWYVSPVEFSLLVVDANPFETYYAIDGADPRIYSDPPAFGDGVFAIEFWSVDKSGNEEAHQFLAFKVDTLAPAVPISSVRGEKFFEGERITVSLSGEESTQIYYSLGGTEPNLYNGPFVILDDLALSAYAVDEAGNQSETVSWDFVFNTVLVVSIVPQVLGAAIEFSEPLAIAEPSVITEDGSVQGVADSVEKTTASPIMLILILVVTRRLKLRVR
jgi:hypothetical protein